MEKIVLELALDNRLFLYRYGWRFFAQEPDEALLSFATGEVAEEQVSVFFGDDSDIAQSQRTLAGRLRDEIAATSLDNILDRLKTQYTKLVIGPKSLPAYPWESSFIDTEGLILQASTLEVRRVYHAAGYEAAGYPHEADDYIGTELDFMASLIEESIEALHAGDEGHVRELLRRQNDFLVSHPNRWLATYAHKLETVGEEKIGTFYLFAARFAAALCRKDVTVLEELLSL